MASVFNKTTGEYKKSVHSPDYDNTYWVINPDVTALVSGGVPQKYWKATQIDPEEDTWIVEEMTQAEKDAVDLSKDEIGNQVISGMFTFESNGNVKNKWLGVGGVRSGKNAPYIAPQPIRISALTFSNLYTNADVSLEFYKNDTLVHTWDLDDTKWAYRAQGLTDITCDAGDRINVFAKKRGNKAPRDVVVTVHYTVINRIIGEGSG